MSNLTTQTDNVFSTQLLADMANILKDNGFSVYWSKWSSSNAKPAYFYFTDGANIGYCQEAYFGGLSFSTVHKPCRECGTGFGLNESGTGIYEPTLKDAERAFIVAPNWAKSNDVRAVRKYKSWEEYTNAPINKMCQYIQY